MDMQAVEITTPGGPDVLRLTRRPIPVPGPGEVLIRVAALGLARPDIAQRQGKYPVPAGVTDIPGLEVSGEIIGGDLTHPANDLGLRLGDRVCALVQGGGYAEYCVAPIAQCLPYPAGFDHVQAAALPETFYTVWSKIGRASFRERVDFHVTGVQTCALPILSGEIIGGDLTHPANDLGLRLGDRVCALVQGGGYAEYCVAPIAQCLPYPAGFDHVQAAALPETFYTVWS